MASTETPTAYRQLPETDPPARVMTFNVNDPMGAAGLAADLAAMASAEVHAMPVVTGLFTRDMSRVSAHHPIDGDLVDEQARTALEDAPANLFKVGFVGTPENVGAVAEILSDYDDRTVITYMPDLSWWDDEAIEDYLSACEELLLPQTTVLVGNYGTLTRWLLPDWEDPTPAGPREIARAAEHYGVGFVLVTGMQSDDGHIDSHLATATATLASARYPRIFHAFVGTGDTLSAVLAGLMARDMDIQQAAVEALDYLDQCLINGYALGMGHAVPDRLFWARGDEIDDDDGTDPDEPPDLSDWPLNDHTH